MRLEQRVVRLNLLTDVLCPVKFVACTFELHLEVLGTTLSLGGLLACRGRGLARMHGGTLKLCNLAFLILEPLLQCRVLALEHLAAVTNAAQFTQFLVLARGQELRECLDLLRGTAEIVPIGLLGSHVIAVLLGCCERAERVLLVPFGPANLELQ